LDTNRNVFGGFTPVGWESRKWNGKRGNENNCSKSDDSRRSFIFTLKNPHDIPARRFALKPEDKERAIWCDSTCGPWFSGMRVSDDCNANTRSYAFLGNLAYTNDTGLDGKTLFTDLQYFQVKEIEVFEVTE
jgi:hypothetical protein